MEGLQTASRAELLRIIMALREQVALLRAEVERLKNERPGGKPPPVPDIKASRENQPKPERKKRANSYVRRRQTPTDVQVHMCASCPDCGRGLSGGSLHHTREVIEIPETPVTITEHRVYSRWCGVCKKRCLPSLDLSGIVLGKHRVGIRLMSLISWLHVGGRVPLRRIQALLSCVYGLHLSLGELSEVLHAVAKAAKPAYDALGEAVKGSPYVHADETGWRQDGVNGYVWSFVTPEVRYFLYNKSRSHEVPEGLLGTEYKGILVSDFYAAYNFHLGLHQRCWVHFLRDLYDLREKNPEDASVALFVDRVVGLYRRARAFVREGAREPDVGYRAERERSEAKATFQKAAMEIARPFLKQDVPQRVLAERIERFLPELFVFVGHPNVPSENNAAERAIRPCVIARKVSGGTRSSKGSDTKMILMSLFGTWQAQGLDLLHACRSLLAAPAPATA